MIARLLLTVVCSAIPAALVAQVATVGPDTTADAAPDPGDVLGQARGAQARFERTRLRHADLSFGGGGGECDEVVGRFCTSYHEGEWYPQEEAEEIVAERISLLSELDSLQDLLPGDEWILGQRAWYRADGGDWAGALATARACTPAPTWRCSALEGLALHGAGHYGPALGAFETALDLMPPGAALEWRIPERAVERAVRGDLRDATTAGPDSLAAALATLWILADPLYLVDGNDRLTEHYARWTVSTLKEDARNPYGIRWSTDLEELTVRHGWELGWERTIHTMFVGREGAIGHKHPEGRDYLPSAAAWRDLSAAAPEDLVADRREPRSLYAPRYAPVLLPIESAVAVFPRGDRTVLVGLPYLPEDTTFHAAHRHPRPWLDAGDQAGMSDRIGLFAVPIAGGDGSVQIVEAGEGALMLDVPLGDYVVSVESWSPERRRAGRARMGVRVARAPEDIATASDILLLRGTERPPRSLEEALPSALVRPGVQSSDPLAIAWELSGLGFRPETVEYELSVERGGRNVFRRIGEFLGLADRPQPLALSWQEPAPDYPTHQFRHLNLDLPPLDPGDYRITLTVRTATRSDVVVTKDFQVVE